MSLNTSYSPSGNFNLTNWKLTLPIDSVGSYIGTAIEIKDLLNYQNSSYFYTAIDGAMVFRAPIEGATTSGSNYARSELREMNGTSRAAWNLTTGGIMTATLEVDQAPIRFDGTVGKVVIGQIHGQYDELVRLYWDNNMLYFANDHAGPNNSELKFYFTDAVGAQPNVSLDERFSYVIDVKEASLEVTIYADGDVYKSVSTINSTWQADSFYFKAGVYLGVNETQGTGWGQTSFYDLRFDHTDTSLTPLLDSNLLLVGNLPSEPVTTHTVMGSNSDNHLAGLSINDLIEGFAGNDVLRGKAGSDVLVGGSGKDAFVFDTAIGKDVDFIRDFCTVDDSIWLQNSIFTKLGSSGQLSSDNFALDSAKDGNDYIIYNHTTGALSYDADGSGSGAPVVFAYLENHPIVSAADFFVI